MCSKPPIKKKLQIIFKVVKLQDFQFRSFISSLTPEEFHCFRHGLFEPSTIFSRNRSEITPDLYKHYLEIAAIFPDGKPEVQTLHINRYCCSRLHSIGGGDTRLSIATCLRIRLNRHPFLLPPALGPISSSVSSLRTH